MLGLVRLANRILRVYFATPRLLRWVFWLLPLAYFLWPIDAVPDLLGGLGRLDDLILIGFAIWLLERSKFFEAFFAHAGRPHGTTSPGSREPQRSPFETLGVDRDVTADALKRAYRKQLSRFHPDKFSHVGAVYEEEAKRKTQEIIEAYARIRRERGWPK